MHVARPEEKESRRIEWGKQGKGEERERGRETKWRREANGKRERERRNKGDRYTHIYKYIKKCSAKMTKEV